MTWFLLSLFPPFLYAITNHIDKILLERYFKNSGVGTLILFSSLLSGFALPFIYFADTNVFNIPLLHILAMITVGILNIGVLWLYLLALRDDEASIVIVFYQLVPVFAILLGYLILGEVLKQLQLIAMMIIILGTTIISFEIDDESNFKLRGKTIFLMIGASFLWALGSVIFKAVSLEESVVRSLFWEHITLTVIGALIFAFIRPYRTHFLSTFKNNSFSVLSLNFVNEFFYMLGNVIFSFAYMLAPIALILLVNSFQTIFVLGLGILLTVFFPKVTVEKIHATHLWQKVFAITITLLGTYILLVL